MHQSFHCLRLFTFLLAITPLFLPAQRSLQPFKEFTKPAQEAQKTSCLGDYPLSFTYYVWDGISVWNASEYCTLSYYPNGDVAEESFAGFNGVTYENLYKNTFQYASPDHVSELLQQSWTGAAWENYARSTTTFTPQGDPVDRLYFSWNGSAWDTTVRSQRLYVYDSLDRMVDLQMNSWYVAGSQWVPQERISFTFDSTNTWDTVYNYTWNGFMWEAYARYFDFDWYDFEQAKAFDMYSQAYDDIWGWVYDTREVCHHADSISDCKYLIYNAPGWDSISRGTERFDSLMNTVSNVYYNYAGGWEAATGARSYYTYDGDCRIMEIVEMELELPNGYEYTERYLFWSFFTGEPEANASQAVLRAYPNPCTDQLHLDLPQKMSRAGHLQVFDLLGRLRIDSQVPSGAATIELPISHAIESGNYVFRLDAGNVQYQGRFSVQR